MILNFGGVNRFLSNFHQATVMFEGERYQTVEHAYQAAKTLDEKERTAIWLCETPAAAKRAGKSVTLRTDWNDIRLGIMEELVRRKFQHPNLKLALLATGDEEIIEGNYWGDTYWGVCKGKGHNHLGKILMKVRNELK